MFLIETLAGLKMTVTVNDIWYDECNTGWKNHWKWYKRKATGDQPVTVLEVSLENFLVQSVDPNTRLVIV